MHYRRIPVIKEEEHGRASAIRSEYLDDYNLAQACGAGDEGAWNSFVQKYAPFAAAVIRRTAAYYDTALTSSEVEDTLGNVFLVLAKKSPRGIASFAGKSSLATWLRKIAGSNTINYLRGLKTPPKSLDAFPVGEPPEELVDSFEKPAESAMKKEASERVNEVLASLNPRNRLIVRLFYFEHRKYREIANILRIPVNSVGPVLTRALSILRERLDPSD